MSEWRRFCRASNFLFFGTLLLTACGGGGGGGDSSGGGLVKVSESEPNNTSDTAQIVDSNVQISGDIAFGAEFAVSETEPNNSLRNANHLVSGNPGIVDSGIVIIGENVVYGTLNQFTDPQDYFQFIPAKSGNVSIRLQVINQVHDLDLEVYDSVGKLLIGKYTDGSESIFSTADGFFVTAGTVYNIRVFAFSATTDAHYDLIVTEGESIFNQSEPNNSPTDADGWAVDDGNIINLGTVNSTTDIIDMHRFEALESGLTTVHLRFDNALYDLDLTIYDSDGITVLDSSKSFDTDELAYFQATAGAIYYWEVYAYFTDSPSVDASYAIAIFSSTRPYPDFLDAFSFTAPQTDTYSFVLTFDSQGDTRDLDLHVYTEDLEEQFSSVLESGGSEEVVIEITQGQTFFVAPTAWNTGFQNTTYSLEITDSGVSVPVAPPTTSENTKGAIVGGGSPR